MLHFSVDYAHFNYEPTPKATYVFQKNVEWTEWTARGVSHVSSTPWGYGFAVRHSTRFTRQSYEQIATHDTYSLGPYIQMLHRFGDYEYCGDYLGLFGSDYGLSTTQRLRRTYGNWILGTGLDLDFFFHKGGHSYSATGQISFGFEF